MFTNAVSAGLRSYAYAHVQTLLTMEPTDLYIKHLFTDTEGNSAFCDPKTTVVVWHYFPEVPVNKWFVIY